MCFGSESRPSTLTYVTLELEIDKIPEFQKPNNVKVRKYNPESDSKIIVILHNEIMKEFRDFSPLTEDFIKNLSTNCTFIAEIDETPVGMGLCTVTDTKKGRLGYIAEFGVIKNYQKRGVGLALLKTILACFKANKVEKVTCEVLEENKLALSILKEKLGFKEIERTAIPPT
ncbi:MAG: GNAT family N-acetyltransferase [Candidatus Jordarchaeaceae archaeon]